MTQDVYLNGVFLFSFREKEDVTELLRINKKWPEQPDFLLSENIKRIQVKTLAKYESIKYLIESCCKWLRLSGYVMKRFNMKELMEEVTMEELTIQDVADIYGTSYWSVSKLAKTRKIPAHKKGTRWMFYRKDIEEHEDLLKEQATRTPRGNLTTLPNTMGPQVGANQVQKYIDSLERDKQHLQEQVIKLQEMLSKALEKLYA